MMENKQFEALSTMSTPKVKEKFTQRIAKLNMAKLTAERDAPVLILQSDYRNTCTIDRKTLERGNLPLFLL